MIVWQACMSVCMFRFSWQAAFPSCYIQDLYSTIEYWTMLSTDNITICPNITLLVYRCWRKVTSDFKPLSLKLCTAGFIRQTSANFHWTQKLALWTLWRQEDSNLYVWSVVGKVGVKEDAWLRLGWCDGGATVGRLMNYDRVRTQWQVMSRWRVCIHGNGCQWRPEGRVHHPVS